MSTDFRTDTRTGPGGPLPAVIDLNARRGMGVPALHGLDTRSVGLDADVAIRTDGGLTFDAHAEQAMAVANGPRHRKPGLASIVRRRRVSARIARRGGSA